MITALVILFFLASLIWGDWKNWRSYQPTILYFILCDFLYNILTYNYPLWTYVPQLMPNHTLINLLVDLVAFPSAAVLFFTHFPKKSLPRQLLYFAGWIALAVGIEWAYKYWLHLFTYSNGWNIYWSIFLDTLIFIFLKIHYEKPLWAYALSVPVIAFFLLMFRVPIGTLR